jgi:hypothetical protein
MLGEGAFASATRLLAGVWEGEKPRTIVVRLLVDGVSGDEAGTGESK